MDEKAKENHSSSNEINEDNVNPESSTSNVQGTPMTTKSNDMTMPGIASSPPQFATMDEIMSAANGLKNMQLAHEIAVDKDFKLAQYEPPENSLERAVKDAVHKVFWDLLSEELSGDPPVYTRAMILLEEVKMTLLDLLYPQHSKLKQEINEMIDIPLIQQQAENGALDFLGYAQYIINVMGRICAPARDEKIQELKEMTDPVQIFKGVFETLTQMRIDLANFNIQLVRSNLLAQSVEYEKTKFAEALALQGGIGTLVKTKKWLRKHVEISTSGLYGDVLPSAYLELLEWSSEEELPETVVMDAARHRELEHRLYQIIISASVLLVTLSRTASPTLQNNLTFKEKLLHDVGVLLQEIHDDESLKKILPNIAVQVIDVVKKYASHADDSVMPPLVHIDDAFEQSLADLLNEIQRPDHNVRRIVRQRLTEFLHLALSSLPNIPQQVPPGLTSLRPSLLAVTGSIIRLYKYNLAVFGEYYAQLIDKIKEESSASV